MILASECKLHTSTLWLAIYLNTISQRSPPVSPTVIVKLNFFLCVCVHVWVCLCAWVRVCVCVHACMNVCESVWRPTHNALNWCNDGERERFPFLPTSWWLCVEVPDGRQFIMCPSLGLSLGEQAGTCVHELPALPPSTCSQWGEANKQRRKRT